MGVYTALFYLSHNFGDLTFLTLTINLVLMVFFNLLTINGFIVAFNRIEGDHRRPLMGIIFVLFAYYMRFPFFKSFKVMNYFVSPFESLFPYLPESIFAVAAFLLGLLLGKEIKRTTLILTILAFHSAYGLIEEEISPWLNPINISNDTEKISIKKKKNVYFILADSYTSVEGAGILGIDQASFLNDLSQRGFELYESFFSSFQPTRYAMPSYLDMSLKNDDKLFYQMSVKSLSKTIAGTGQVYQVFKYNNYQINIIHWSRYLIGKYCYADMCYPPSDLNKYLGLFNKIFFNNVLALFFELDTTRWGAIKKLQSIILIRI